MLILQKHFTTFYCYFAASKIPNFCSFFSIFHSFFFFTQNRVHYCMQQTTATTIKSRWNNCWGFENATECFSRSHVGNLLHQNMAHCNLNLNNFCSNVQCNGRNFYSAQRVSQTQLPILQTDFCGFSWNSIQIRTLYIDAQVITNAQDILTAFVFPLIFSFILSFEWALQRMDAL